MEEMGFGGVLDSNDSFLAERKKIVDRRDAPQPGAFGVVFSEQVFEPAPPPLEVARR